MSVPGFAEFYEAVHQRPPFPWQQRLAEQVADAGWPSQIGIPTGLGKTSCLDIGVWSLAAQAERRPDERTAPTRIWYVVNRRLLVDTAHDHALDLAARLRHDATGEGDAIRAVRDALASIGGVDWSHGPLHVARLRGGVTASPRPPDPSCPAIILATVPMAGSRLLFRGYGSSTGMRPIDAALAGTDSVLLLDEAHLSEPFSTVVTQAAACDRGHPELVAPGPRSRVNLVALTATGDAVEERFELDADDLAHPVVQRRLSASKPARVVEVSKSKLVSTVAEQAATLAASAASTVVFLNTPATASAVHQRLAKKLKQADVVLVTGRFRPVDADAIRTRILDPDTGAPAGRSPSGEASGRLVVVATQTLEVGADLDFDAMVSEVAGVRSLTQRLGRLNRLGERPQAPAVIVGQTDMDTWPVYGAEPAAVLQRLRAAGPEVDLSPSLVASTLGEPDDAPARSPELMPSLLREWVKTTLPPPGEAPVELFLNGIEPENARVAVCWRSWAPDEGELIPRLASHELVEVPIGEVRVALGELDSVRRLDMTGAAVTSVPVESVRPGDTLVLSPHDRCYSATTGWVGVHDSGFDPVIDVSLQHARSVPLRWEALAPHGVPPELRGPLMLLNDANPGPGVGPVSTPEQGGAAGAGEESNQAATESPAAPTDGWEEELRSVERESAVVTTDPDEELRDLAVAIARCLHAWARSAKTTERGAHGLPPWLGLADLVSPDGRALPVALLATGTWVLSAPRVGASDPAEVRDAVGGPGHPCGRLRRAVS